MKKLWLASPLLLASLCLAAQTGSSPSSNSATQPSASQSSSQNPNSNATTPSTDQNQTATPSTSDQSNPSASDQNANASDQNNANTSASQSSTNAKKLPQTASPLPLLGLLGLGSLGAGLFRFRKR
jgi:LPXTG-motif cell wall-anchored protein